MLYDDTDAEDKFVGVVNMVEIAEDFLIFNIKIYSIQTSLTRVNEYLRLNIKPHFFEIFTYRTYFLNET